jgi:hypothetical protein
MGIKHLRKVASNMVEGLVSFRHKTKKDQHPLTPKDGSLYKKKMQGTPDGIFRCGFRK